MSDLMRVDILNLIWLRQVRITLLSTRLRSLKIEILLYVLKILSMRMIKWYAIVILWKRL